MTSAPSRRRTVGVAVAALQVVVTVGLLWLVVARFGVEPFVRAAASLPWWALCTGVALGGVGVSAQALRWRLVARRLDIRINVGSAVGRVWQAAFLNSVLPGGLAGDALRALDDSSDATSGTGRQAVASGFAAVAAERLAGTAVVFTAAAVALASLAPFVAAGCGAAAVVAVAVAWRWMRRLPARDILTVAVLSVLGWAAFAGIFVVATAALAPEVVPGAMPVVAAVSIAGMSVPIGVGGWGPREATSGWAFELVGLDPAAGVTVSIGYGLMALCSTLPGAAILALRAAPRSRAVGHARSRRRRERELRAEVVAEGEASH